MRGKTDRQVATIVPEKVYAEIRMAAAMEQKSVSEWFRGLIVPAAGAAVKKYAAKRKRKGATT